MPFETYKHWPFSVLPSGERTEFQSALIALLEAAHAAGHKAYVSEMETLIGFGEPGRRAVVGGRREVAFLTFCGAFVRPPIDRDGKLPSVPGLSGRTAPRGRVR